MNFATEDVLRWLGTAPAHCVEVMVPTHRGLLRIKQIPQHGVTILFGLTGK